VLLLFGGRPGPRFSGFTSVAAACCPFGGIVCPQVEHIVGELE
jgi:hypothetical protein